MPSYLIFICNNFILLKIKFSMLFTMARDSYTSQHIAPFLEDQISSPRGRTFRSSCLKIWELSLHIWLQVNIIVDNSSRRKMFSFRV